MLEIVKIISDNKNWEDLLAASPYCLKIAKDESYVLFKYDQIKSDFNLPAVREARGLILRNDNFKVVCHPFDKFGNYGEYYCPEIDWNTASVQEKIDGSLMKLWFDDNKWRLSTNNTIDAFKAPMNVLKYKTFGDLFLAACKVSFDELTAKLDTDYTYMFELVSPFNRIVIEYTEIELYFLGARNNITQQEYMPEQTDFFSYNLFKIPKRYNLKTLDEVKNAADALPWSEEGYVVCDKNFNRVKIKSPKYVEAHYMRNNNSVTYERLFDILKQGEKDEFLIYASDLKEELEKVESAYYQMKKELESYKAKIKEDMFESRKDFALKVQEQPKWVQAFLYRRETADELIDKTNTSRIIEVLKEGKFLNE